MPEMFALLLAITYHVWLYIIYLNTIPVMLAFMRSVFKLETQTGRLLHCLSVEGPVKHMSNFTCCPQMYGTSSLLVP
jgi:hypothetical protein